MRKIIQNLYNQIDFFFRRNIRIKRKYEGKNEPKETLFAVFDEKKRQIAEEKERLYLEKYNLSSLKENSTRRNYLENLAVIELLESSLSSYQCQNSVKILDVGSKNWFYASGEWHYFKYNTFCHPELVSGSESLKQIQNENIEREIFLDGIEIDAFRVYSDFHTRYDYAQFYIKNLENTRYFAKDFLKHNEKYDYIIWFFPFVTEFPLMEWGLPLSKFKPEDMLKHAYNSLNPNGKILIVNQDENEYVLQENLIKSLNLHYEKKGNFENSFIEYERKRCVTVIFKENQE